MKKFLSFILIFGILFGNISNLKAEEITNEELEKLLENPNQVCKANLPENSNFTFNYSKTEIQNLPKDVILILDHSGSMLSIGSYITKVLKNFLPTLGEKDRIFLSIYNTNDESSYKYIHKKRFFTKENFSEIVDINPSLSHLKLSDNVGNIEEEYEKDTNKNPIVSVLQITDQWFDNETIDTSFATWALTNAKTFMTVVLGRKQDTDLSVREMKKAGHNNIYWKDRYNSYLIEEDFESINSQFKNETFFKPVLVKLIPENGARLLSSFLVHKDSGSKQELTVVDGAVNQEIVPEKEGEFYFDYTYETTENANLNIEVYYKNKQNANVLLENCQLKEIPFETIYEPDETKEVGTSETFREGENGKKENGKIKKDPINKIVKIGTKPKVETREIPFETTYKSDDNSTTDTTETEGINGSVKTTTTYTVNPKTGEVTENSNSVRTDPTTKIVKVGTKPKIIEENGQKFQTIKKEDSSIERGREVIETKGQNEKIVKTTTYTVNPKTGEITENTSTEIIPAIDEVIRVGTKSSGSAPNPEDFKIKNDSRVTSSNSSNEEKIPENEEKIELNSAPEKQEKIEEIEEKNISEKTENKKEEIKYLDEFYFDREVPMEIEHSEVEQKSEKTEVKMNNVKISKLPKTGPLAIFMIIFSLIVTFGIFKFRRRKI